LNNRFPKWRLQNEIQILVAPNEKLGTYQLSKKFFDVEGGEKLPLSVNHNLAWWLARDRLVGFHDLNEGVNFC
jgi:hypothetical protein